MRVRLFSLFLCAAVSISARAAEPVTFRKDILPIFQTHCQECHRAGEIGPMPLSNYKEARPWAAAIKESVVLRKMPPWFADPHFGKFANDRSLSAAQIETIRDWVDRGAPEGNPKEAPPPRKFIQGWNIPEPDLVLQVPKPFPIPASGQVDYQYIVLPTGFKEDRWVQMAETRPGDRSVVHHMVIFVRDPASTWLPDAQPGVPYVPKRAGNLTDIGGGGSEILTVYTPGMAPEIWKPNQGKLIKAGSDLVLQVHYTPNGKATEDQTKIGLVFAKEKPTERVISTQAANTRFAIPPGDPDFEVTGRTRFANSVKVVSLFPHMHLRGKDFEYRAVYPSGETQVLLRVPAYQFNWQLAYKPEEEIVLPPGTRIECTAHYDNSANNPRNPDPKAEVRFGEQSREEMMVGFMDIAIPADADPRAFLSRALR